MTHPGPALKTALLKKYGTVTAAAVAVGIGRPALSSVLNGRADLSADLAVRIGVATGQWFWHLRQCRHDMEEALKKYGMHHG